MPTYEYRCEKCGHEFEREQRITEDPIKTCPKCKSQKARRLISATSFVLKGGGWYSDLYSSGSASKKGEKKDEKKGAEGGSSSESKSDSGSGTSSGTGTKKSESKSSASA